MVDFIIMIILLSIVGMVSIGVAITLLYLRHRRLKLILRCFLHDIGNHLMAFSSFHQIFPLEYDQKVLQKLANENKILFLQISAYVQGFKSYLEEGKGKISLENIELNELLQQRKALINQCDYADLYQWNFNISDNPFILKTNPYLLNCLMDNLVGNAIKHTKRGGRVSVVFKEYKKMGRLIIRNEKGRHFKAKPGDNQGLYFVKKISPKLRSKIVIKDEKDFYTVVCDFDRAVQL